MRAMSTLDERKLDKRVVERSLHRGLLSKDAYAQYLEQLTDVSENASFVAYGEEEDTEEQPQ